MSLEVRVWKRLAAPEVRAVGDAAPIITGAAAVFGRLSQNLGGWVEQIMPGAFDSTLNSGANVLGLVNHADDWLLGTTDSKTLRVTSDAAELRYEIDVDVADPDSVRALRKVETGKLRGSSFCFRVLPDGESWSTTPDGFPLRTITAASLFDVGPVTSPAYLATQEGDAAVSLRNLARTVGVEVRELVAAAGAGELAQFVRSAPIEADPPEADAQPARSTESRLWQIVTAPQGGKLT